MICISHAECASGRIPKIDRYLMKLWNPVAYRAVLTASVRSVTRKVVGQTEREMAWVRNSAVNYWFFYATKTTTTTTTLVPLRHAYIRISSSCSRTCSRHPPASSLLPIRNEILNSVTQYKWTISLRYLTYNSWKISNGFYRAMHFSAYARSWDRMSSVCPSVCLWRWWIVIT